jgi:hypothetical protein
VSDTLPSDFLERLAQSQETFLETELGLAQAFSDLAETRYRAGHDSNARRARNEALTAILTIRYFLDERNWLSEEKRKSLHNRCDYLELSLERFRMKSQAN